MLAVARQFSKLFTVALYALYALSWFFVTAQGEKRGFDEQFVS
jgi:hypothetical protein